MENMKEFIATSVSATSVSVGRGINGNIDDMTLTIELDLVSNGDFSHLIKEDGSVDGILLMDYLIKKYLGK